MMNAAAAGGQTLTAVQPVQVAGHPQVMVHPAGAEYLTPRQREASPNGPRSIRFFTRPIQFIKWLQQRGAQFEMQQLEDSVEVHVPSQEVFRQARHFLELYYTKTLGRYRFCPADEEMWEAILSRAG